MYIYDVKATCVSNINLTVVFKYQAFLLLHLYIAFIYAVWFYIGDSILINQLNKKDQSLIIVEDCVRMIELEK